MAVFTVFALLVEMEFVAAATAPLLIAPTPDIERESVAEKCGGVIDMTVPRPPSVPPAISSPRFIYPPFRNPSASARLNLYVVLNRDHL